MTGAPLTLSEAQDRFTEAAAKFRAADCLDEIDALGREILGLQRLIVWLRARETRSLQATPRNQDRAIEQ